MKVTPPFDFPYRVKIETKINEETIVDFADLGHEFENKEFDNLFEKFKELLKKHINKVDYYIQEEYKIKKESNE